MFEQENNYERDTYENNLVRLSRYADAVLLTARRQQFRERGVQTDFADYGILFDIMDAELAAFCLSRLLDPVTGASISAFGDPERDSDISKRSLSFTVTSRELETTYWLQCNRDWYGQVSLAKNRKRIYGIPEVERGGVIVPTSAMFEPVPCDNSISDDEFELLFRILDYVEMNDLTRT